MLGVAGGDGGGGGSGAHGGDGGGGIGEHVRRGDEFGGEGDLGPALEWVADWCFRSLGPGDMAHETHFVWFALFYLYDALIWSAGEFKVELRELVDGFADVVRFEV